MIKQPHLALVAAALLFGFAADLARADSTEVAFGRRIAERNCGGCHAVGAGRSPNPKSPPFRRLYGRYRHRLGGLDAILSEGMLAPSVPPEEGSPRRHPSMPQVALGDDEVAALKAYLHSLAPPLPPRRQPTR